MSNMDGELYSGVAYLDGSDAISSAIANSKSTNDNFPLLSIGEAYNYGDLNNVLQVSGNAIFSSNITTSNLLVLADLNVPSGLIYASTIFTSNISYYTTGTTATTLITSSNITTSNINTTNLITTNLNTTTITSTGNVSFGSNLAVTSNIHCMNLSASSNITTSNILCNKLTFSSLVVNGTLPITTPYIVTTSSNIPNTIASSLYITGSNIGVTTSPSTLKYGGYTAGGSYDDIGYGYISWAAFVSGYTGLASTGTMYDYCIGRHHEILGGSGVSLFYSLRCANGILLDKGHIYNMSDERLKENIKPIGTHRAFDTINALKVSRYQFKKRDDEEVSVGFIAQEVQKVLPQAVSVSDKDGLLCIDKMKIYDMHIAATQHLIKRLNTLYIIVGGLFIFTLINGIRKW